MSSESIVGKDFRVTCEEDLLKIPDLLTAREFCKNWGIDRRGIEDLKDAIPKLVEHFRENEKRPKEEVKKVVEKRPKEMVKKVVKLEGMGLVKDNGSGAGKRIGDMGYRIGKVVT